MQARHCSGIPTPGGITSKSFPTGDVFRLSHNRSLTYRCLCKLRPEGNTDVCGKNCSYMSYVWVISREHIQIRRFFNTFTSGLSGVFSKKFFSLFVEVWFHYCESYALTVNVWSWKIVGQKGWKTFWWRNQKKHSFWSWLWQSVWQSYKQKRVTERPCHRFSSNLICSLIKPASKCLPFFIKVSHSYLTL